MKVSFIAVDGKEYMWHRHEAAQRFRAQNPVRGVRHAGGELGDHVEKAARDYLSELGLELSAHRVLRLEDMTGASYLELDGAVGQDPPKLIFEVKLASDPAASVRKGRKQLRRARMHCRESFPDMRAAVIVVPWADASLYRGSNVLRGVAEFCEMRWSVFDVPVLNIPLDDLWGYITTKAKDSLLNDALRELRTGRRYDLSEQPAEKPFGAMANALRVALEE